MQELEFKIDLEKSLGPWIGKTIKMTDYYLFEAFQKQGLDISKEQMIVLKKLHIDNGLSQNELAKLTWRDKSSMARLLAKMERKGYIVKRQDPSDKRVNHIFLTEKGRSVFHDTRPIIKKAIQILEKDLNKTEIQETIKILKRIQDNFKSELASL